MTETKADTGGTGRKWGSRPGQARPRSISAVQQEWVEMVGPADLPALPLLVRPRVRSVDLASWLGANYALLEEPLRSHGAILLRGFGLRGQEDFERVLRATPIQLTSYVEGATPRTKLGEKVYTSTEFPADQTIALHNELSYVTSWPMRILFFCTAAAPVGGETPIADVRKVLARIDSAVQERFRRSGWMLVRNFQPGLGPSWRGAYRCDDQAAAERYFGEHDIEFEWLPGERLRTRQVRPAIARHPVTGELVWFNHVAFWHHSSLPDELRRVLLGDGAEEDLPYNTYYGDGSPIEEEVVAHLRDAYRQETRASRWEEGDLLLLDNMLVAHGRSPFQGPRRILTAMGDPCSERGV